MMLIFFNLYFLSSHSLVTIGVEEDVVIFSFFYKVFLLAWVWS